MKSYLKLLGAILLLPAFSLGGCSSGDPGAFDESESLAETSFAIQPNDKNRCWFPESDTAAECNARDGVFFRSSGPCIIVVEQDCDLIEGPSGATGCLCKVTVLDTMVGCNNKDWDDFYGKCQN
jgi:hypothetical protein